MDIAGFDFHTLIWIAIAILVVIWLIGLISRGAKRLIKFNSPQNVFHSLSLPQRLASSSSISAAVSAWSSARALLCQ